MSDEEIELDVKLMLMLKDPPKHLFEPEEFKVVDHSMVNYDKTVKQEQVDSKQLEELDKFLDSIQ